MILTFFGSIVVRRKKDELCMDDAWNIGAPIARSLFQIFWFLQVWRDHSSLGRAAVSVPTQNPWKQSGRARWDGSWVCTYCCWIYINFKMLALCTSINVGKMFAVIGMIAPRHSNWAKNGETTVLTRTWMMYLKH